MEKLRKLFGGIELPWWKLILFAIAAGVYTAVMAILPQAKDTSFADITITMECWVLFGIFIITNSKSPLDSGLKCFVFFLISQPLVYLIQVPFAELGFGLFGYYKYWFILTLFTFPMGFIGYYMKKDKWWGILILAPILVLLALLASGFVRQAIYWFPHHLLSAVFCIVSMFIYVIAIFRNKIAVRIGLALDIVLVVMIVAYTLLRPYTYDTILLVNEGQTGTVFDDTCQVSLKDPGFGDVSIVYDEGLEDYMVKAELRRAGQTELILETADGSRQEFSVDIKQSSFEISKIGD